MCSLEVWFDGGLKIRLTIVLEVCGAGGDGGRREANLFVGGDTDIEKVSISREKKKKLKKLKMDSLTVAYSYI